MSSEIKAIKLGGMAIESSKDFCSFRIFGDGKELNAAECLKELANNEAVKRLKSAHGLCLVIACVEDTRYETSIH